jgi:hypothetical protein
VTGTGQPKEGIYLEATLGVIENKVMTAIEDTSRTRRRRRWLGVAALAVVALAGTSAASALGIRQAQITWSVADEGEAWQLMCIEGDRIGTAPYYGVRFRVASADAALAIDATRVCATAWEASTDASEPIGSLDAGSAEYLSDLIDGVLSDELARQGLDATEYDVETGYAERIDHSTAGMPAMGLCVNVNVPRSLYVITGPSESDWSKRCRISGTAGWSYVPPDAERR